MARILVVDDEPLIAMMAEDWLLELGHQIVGPANDLQSGLDLAKTEIDGALVDVSLGRESGFEIADALSSRKIPFVFATGHALSGAALEYKPIAILTKPFDFDMFARAVESMLMVGRHPKT
jgi:CheY-like chemotaxis protein